MPDKLSQQLLDAYMVGDQESVASIKADLEKKYENTKRSTRSKFEIPTILNDDTSSAIKVYDFLNRAFGNDWWEWEIETLDMMLFIDYGVALEPINKDKILAIRHVCNSDGCFSDWYEFNQVALSFAGAMADFEFLRSPSPGMTINAIKVINYIRPDREAFFSNDVLKYICIVFYDNGIYVPPPTIFGLINETMKNFVSKEMIDKWPTILEKIKSIAGDETKYEFEEDDVNVQAVRVINAESAALAYNK